MSQVVKDITATPAYKPSEGKREEFRKYLEKHGVLDALTKVLVNLYEEVDKPEDTMEYIRDKLAFQSGVQTFKQMQVKMTELQERVKELEEQLEQLKKQSAEAVVAAAEGPAEAVEEVKEAAVEEVPAPVEAAVVEAAPAEAAAEEPPKEA